jgi:hypothetical protein
MSGAMCPTPATRLHMPSTARTAVHGHLVYVRMPINHLGMAAIADDEAPAQRREIIRSGCSHHMTLRTQARVLAVIRVRLDSYRTRNATAMSRRRRRARHQRSAASSRTSPSAARRATAEMLDVQARTGADAALSREPHVTKFGLNQVTPLRMRLSRIWPGPPGLVVRRCSLTAHGLPPTSTPRCRQGPARAPAVVAQPG